MLPKESEWVTIYKYHSYILPQIPHPIEESCGDNDDIIRYLTELKTRHPLFTKLRFDLKFGSLYDTEDGEGIGWWELQGIPNNPELYKVLYGK